jgi:hypothetical protein
MDVLQAALRYEDIVFSMNDQENDDGATLSCKKNGAITAGDRLAFALECFQWLTIDLKGVVPIGLFLDDPIAHPLTLLMPAYRLEPQTIDLSALQALEGMEAILSGYFTTSRLPDPDDPSAPLMTKELACFHFLLPDCPKDVDSVDPAEPDSAQTRRSTSQSKPNRL